MGIADLLVIVVIADAAQNAMAGTYTSITDGILLICTIIGWNLALDWLAFRVPAIRRVIEPQPVHLVQNGRVIRRNMRKVLLTDEELMSQFRLQGCMISPMSNSPVWRTMAGSASSSARTMGSAPNAHGSDNPAEIAPHRDRATHEPKATART